jgi:hypothetical protein
MGLGGVMWRAGRGHCFGLMVLGVLALSATGSGGEGLPKGEFQLACTAAAAIDLARATTVCTELADMLRDRSGLSLKTDVPAPIAFGPGLEIVVTAASDTMVEVVPTWVDASGNRTTTLPRGLTVADTTLTATMRKTLYQGVLSGFPF